MTEPNTHRPVPTKALLTVVFLVLATTGWLFWNRLDTLREARAQQASAKEATAPVVTVETPRRRDLVSRVTFNGTLRPINDVDIFAKVPGRVEKVLVKLGDRVKAGQLLAVLEFQEAELQRRQADAQVVIAEAGVEHARNNVDAIKRQYERLLALAKGDSVPPAEVEKMESAVKASETAVKLAEGQRDLARAAAGLAALAVDYRRVTSPIEGVVVSRSVNVGSQTAPAMPLFKVVDGSVLKLEAQVGPVEYGLLQVGQRATVRVQDLQEHNSAGEVSAKAPMLDMMTRRALVEVMVPNATGALLPNSFATAAVEAGKQEGVLSIGQQALVPDPHGPVVYVVRDGKAVPIKNGAVATEDEFVPVRSEIKETDLVIMSGQSRVTAGGAVRVAGAQP